MSDDESKLPPKVYFRIGEVASLVGVEPHVLRYWEREFRTIRPRKSARGQRVYSRKDVETLMRVRQLLYSEGFTIAGARRRLQQERAGNGAALEPAEIANHAGDAGEDEAASMSGAAPLAARMPPPSPSQLTLEAITAPERAAAERTPAPTRIAAPALVVPAPMTTATIASSNGHAHGLQAASADAAQAVAMRSTLRELRRDIESFLEEIGAG